MVVITRATFGDEFSSTDVLKSIRDRFKDGSIDLYVDSSIIPFVDKVSGVQTVQLSNEEKADIKEAVAEMCGPNDQVCMQVKTQEQVAQKLKEKEVAKASSTTEVIKGRRLTVEYTLPSGEKRTAVVPEGQQFQLGDLGKKYPDRLGPIDTKPSLGEQLYGSLSGTFKTAIFTFLYASSIIITWMTYIKYGSKLLAGGMVAIAALIPLSGFGLSFFGALAAEYFRVERVARLRADIPGALDAMASAPPSFLPKTAEGFIPTHGPSLLPKTAQGFIPTAPAFPEDPSALAADMRGGRFLSRRK